MTLRESLRLILVTLVGLGGLFYAAIPDGGSSYGIGLVVFGAALIYGFVLVKQHFDRIDSERH